jgi:predicted AAA+ superfamily ATPase
LWAPIGSRTHQLTEPSTSKTLNPYAAKVKKHLIKSPKLYVRDSGILHTLLNIPDYNTLSLIANQSF